LNTYSADSLQGDASLVQIYRKYFGVTTQFNGDQIILRRASDFEFQDFELNLNDTPDLAQTLAVTCAGLKIKSKLTGLETLSIKETDRLTALQNELKKIGAVAEITENSLEIVGFERMTQIPVIETYNDHRMAMSFAPL